MTGLRSYDRDANLPALAGDAQLCPPSIEEMLARVLRDLQLDSGPRAIEVTWEYSRWKPHVAVSALYRVRFEDGLESFVTYKRYTGDKAGQIEDWAPDDDALEAAQSGAQRRLRPFVARMDEGSCLFSFPYDRTLTGLPRVLDLQRTCRLLAREFDLGSEKLRWRRSRAEILRYKPEHRAVLRLDLVVRDERGELGPRTTIARVLEPQAAHRAFQARTSLELSGFRLGPRLIAAEERTGILFEEFLDVISGTPEDFSHAFEAGRVLADLHTRSTPSAIAAVVSDSDESLALFEIDDNLRVLASSLAGPQSTSGRRAWVHGDFHPDQLAISRTDGTLRLLDWDNLHVGDPLDDVASWIADALASPAEPDWQAASHDLLRGYAAGGAPAFDEGALRARVARELILKAAATLRRLEHNAPHKAAQLLARAQEFSPRAHPAAAPFPWGRAGLEIERRVGPGAARCVRRTEVRDDGELVFALENTPTDRWFAVRDGAVRELHPRDESALPGAPALVRACELGSGDILSWRPGRRMVVRLGRGEGLRVVKAYRRKHALKCGALTERIRADLSGRGFRVPHVLSMDAEGETLTFEFVHGRELVFEGLERFLELGQFVAHMQHDLAALELDEHSRFDELAVLDRAMRRFVLAGGELPSGFTAARRSLEGDAASQRPLVFAHRDLHDGQFLFSPDAVTLIDFDLAARAEPELDIANLVAHFHLCALQGLRGADACKALSAEAALLQGFGSGTDERSLSWFRASTHLRLYLIYALRPRWAHILPDLLALALTSAEGLEHV